MANLLKEAVAAEAAESVETAAAAEAAEEFSDGSAAAGVRIAFPELSFLAAPTGPGAIEEYIDHPMNFDNRRSTARILRGLTGIAGELDYALIDIALGTIEKIQERKNGTDQRTE